MNHPASIKRIETNRGERKIRMLFSMNHPASIKRIETYTCL